MNDIYFSLREYFYIEVHINLLVISPIDVLYNMEKPTCYIILFMVTLCDSYTKITRFVCSLYFLPENQSMWHSCEKFDK